MRTIRPIYSENKLEADINTGKNGAIIFIGAVMTKCNSYVLNYICLASFPGISLVYVSKLFHSSSHVRYQSNLLISSLLAPTPSPYFITVQSAGRTKTELMRRRRNRRPLGKWHCRAH